MWRFVTVNYFVTAADDDELVLLSAHLLLSVRRSDNDLGHRWFTDLATLVSCLVNFCTCASYRLAIISFLMLLFNFVF